MPPTSNFVGRDVVSVRDLSRSEIDQILDMAQVMEPLAKTGSDMLHGKIMATLFYEPSTRTKLSFETAMTRLGGTALGFAETKGTSVEKGENLADTVRVVENYADLLGRTVHSLAYALAKYKVRLVLISPEILKMRKEVLEEVSKKIDVEETISLQQHLKELDVIYMTRVQKERFGDLAEYEKVKGSYRLTSDELARAKKSSIVMHPLPRMDEIDSSVDSTSHAKYFPQVGNGVVLRMGLLGLVFGAL